MFIFSHAQRSFTSRLSGFASALLLAPCFLGTSFAYASSSFQLNGIPSSHALGNSLTLSWKAKTTKPYQSFALVLKQTQPPAFNTLPGSLAQYPLMQQTLPLAKQEGVFVWDGKQFACAPSETPAFCEGLEPGRYEWVVYGYSQQDVPLVGFFADTNNSEKEVLFQSAPFSLTGSPNMTRMQQLFDQQALKHTKETFGFFSYSGTHILPRYVAPQGAPSVRRDGSYCANYRLNEPFSGFMSVCERAKQGIILTGPISYTPGVLPYKEALEKALQATEAAYADAARPHLGTSMSYNLSNWIYKGRNHTATPYWGFLIYAGEVGGSQSLKRSERMVFAKVFNDGSTVLSEPATEKNSLSLAVDLWQEPL